MYISLQSIVISIHAPPRGATIAAMRAGSSCPFQFTPLREGRRAVLRVVFFHFVFQFTPLREGRHLASGVPVLPICISIHAPPRGATLHESLCLHGKQISIHAPPRGATCWAGCSFVRWIHISIHAPPRGATLKPTQLLHNGLFQFTPLREGRRRRR